MTRKEITKHLKSLPQDLFEAYGFQMPYDYTDEPYEIVNGYKYFPSQHCIMIDSRPVVWDKETSGLCKIDPHNPEHFAELERRGNRFSKHPCIGIITFDRKGRMKCDLYEKASWPDRFIKQPETFISFPFDNTEIFYDPICNIKNNKHLQLLAECLFLAQRYKPEFIIPYQNSRSVEDWGVGD